MRTGPEEGVRTLTQGASKEGERYLWVKLNFEVMDILEEWISSLKVLAPRGRSQDLEGQWESWRGKLNLKRLLEEGTVTSRTKGGLRKGSQYLEDKGSLRKESRPQGQVWDRYLEGRNLLPRVQGVMQSEKRVCAIAHRERDMHLPRRDWGKYGSSLSWISEGNLLAKHEWQLPLKELPRNEKKDFLETDSSSNENKCFLQYIAHQNDSKVRDYS